MRFSYIDSQGKEIEVDSVESLALRIELGAIREDTRMYDAVADRWAPAEDHPVYRSLSRGEEWDDEDWVEKESTAEADPEAGTPDEDEAPPEAEEPEVETDAPEEAPAEAGSGDDALGLDFTVSVAEDPGDAPAGADDLAGEADHASLQKPTDDAGESDPGDAVETVGDPAEEGFGELGPLEVEEVEDQVAPEYDEDDGLGAPSPEETPSDAVAPEPDPVDPDSGDAPFGPASSDESSGPGDGSPEGGARPDFEEPVPGFTEDRPGDEGDMPSWAEEGESLWDDEESPTEEATSSETPGAASHRELLDDDPVDPQKQMPEWGASEDPERGGGAASEDEITEPRPDRPSAPRPKHWQERREIGEGKPRLYRAAQVVGVLVVLGGLAGYFLLEPGADAPEVEPDAASASSLSPELRGILVPVADDAYGQVLEELRAQTGERDLPPAPPPEWLDGVYLSTAGAYPGVEEYWRGVSEEVQTFQAREQPLYIQRLTEELTARSGDPTGSGSELAAGDVSLVLDAGRSGYQATAPARDSVYDGILAMATASLELHDLLLENQDDIAYEPYSDPGVSRDPVLEAVPADSLLRREMNAGLDRVIDAILRSGVDRPITTEGLFDHLVEALEEVGTVDEPDPGTGDGSAPVTEEP